MAGSSRGSRSRAPRYASRQLSERMKEAGEQLALDFKKATALEHAGARGSHREESVRNFLAERLPGGYAVTTGFTFDARDKQSKQLDVLIYRVRDTPFLLAGDPVLVPCESLLAAIEIKSEINTEELGDALEIASSIRSLRPFDKAFADARDRGTPADDRPRCLFSLFGFGTNLVEGEDWLVREGNRFMGTANRLSIPPQYVDRLIVMDRGVINCAVGRGHDSARSGQSALQIWFVHLINHLLREDRRRKEIDIDIYTGGDRWMALPAWKDSTVSPIVTDTVFSPARGVRKVAPGARRRGPRGEEQ
jgi:hypothetical protein